jgi:hypothetical protein
MADPDGLPEHAARNRAHWDEAAAGYVAAGEQLAAGRRLGDLERP